MRGPDLTTAELLTYLARRIERYERLDLSRRQAIRLLADEHKIDETKLTAFLDRFNNVASVPA